MPEPPPGLLLSGTRSTGRALDAAMATGADDAAAASSASGTMASGASRTSSAARWLACGSSGESSSSSVRPRDRRVRHADYARLRRNKWINSQVTHVANSGNIHRLLQTIQQHIHEMNAINLATALHRVTRLAVVGGQGTSVDWLLKHPTFLLLRSTVVNQIESALQPKASGAQKNPSFEVECMSIVCWSCATLRLREEQLMTTIADIVLPRLSVLKPFELSNMVWAYAKLSVGKPELFAAISRHMFQRVPMEFSLQCLSMIVWSFATAKVKDAALFSNLAKEITDHAVFAKPQEISNTLWSYAKNRYQEAPLFNALADAAIDGKLIWYFKPQELSNTVWAFATVGLHHTPLFRQVVPVAIIKRRELSPQNSANILWAYAKLQVCRRSGLFPALLSASVDNVSQHKPQELSAIAWAASREGYSDCKRFFGTTAQLCFERLHEFSPQALANMLEAFAVISDDCPGFSDAMAQESVSRLHQFEPVALCNLFRGVVLVARRRRAAHGSGGDGGIEKTEGSLEAVSQHITKRLLQLQESDLAHVFYSLQLLGPSPVVRKLYPATANLASLLPEVRQRYRRAGGPPRAPLSAGSAAWPPALSTASSEEEPYRMEKEETETDAKGPSDFTRESSNVESMHENEGFGSVIDGVWGGTGDYSDMTGKDHDGSSCLLELPDALDSEQFGNEIEGGNSITPSEGHWSSPWPADHTSGHEGEYFPPWNLPEAPLTASAGGMVNEGTCTTLGPPLSWRAPWGLASRSPWPSEPTVMPWGLPHLPSESSWPAMPQNPAFGSPAAKGFGGWGSGGTSLWPGRAAQWQAPETAFSSRDPWPLVDPWASQRSYTGRVGTRGSNSSIEGIDALFLGPSPSAVLDSECERAPGTADGEANTTILGGTSTAAGTVGAGAGVSWPPAPEWKPWGSLPSTGLLHVSAAEPQRSLPWHVAALASPPEQEGLRLQDLQATGQSGPAAQDLPFPATVLQDSDLQKPRRVDASCLVQARSGSSEGGTGGVYGGGQDNWAPLDLQECLNVAVVGSGTSVVQLRRGMLDERVVVKRMAAGPAAWPVVVTQHPHVLAPCAEIITGGETKEAGDCYMAYRHCAHGTLAEWILARQSEGKVPSVEEAARIVTGILGAASLMLSLGLDISAVRASEIFIDHSREPQLRLRHDSIGSGATCGTEGGDASKWLSPEEVAEGAAAAWPAVAFRVGLILYCLGTGLPDPYPHKHGALVMLDLKREVSGAGRPVRPDASRYVGPEVLRELMEACLLPQASGRPSQQRLLEVVHQAMEESKASSEFCEEHG